jgi:hypothetical protein
MLEGYVAKLDDCIDHFLLRKLYRTPSHIIRQARVQA